MTPGSGIFAGPNRQSHGLGGRILRRGISFLWRDHFTFPLANCPIFLIIRLTKAEMKTGMPAVIVLGEIV